MSEGRKALIVEAEYLVGLHIQTILEGLGFTTADILHDSRDGLRWLRQAPAIDLAIIEIDLDHSETLDFARSILDTGIRLIGITTDLRIRAGIAGLPCFPILHKPIPEEALAEAVEAVFGTTVPQWPAGGAGR